MIKYLFLFFLSASYSFNVFAQQNIHFVKPVFRDTPWGLKAEDFEIQPAVFDGNSYSLYDNESIEGMYLMVPGKKIFYIEESWWCKNIDWCTQSIDASSLEDKIEKPIHFIISADLQNSVNIPDISNSLQFINNFSDLHYHDYHYSFTYEFKDLSVFNLEEIFDGTNYCYTGDHNALQIKIDPWQLEREIVVFVSNSLIAQLNTHGTLRGKAYECCNPQIIIGGISITADHFLLQHELYHLNNLKDESNFLYCDDSTSNIMNNYSSLCDYFLNSKQVLLNNNNAPEFHNTINLSEVFPQTSVCICPDLNDIISTNNLLKINKNNISNDDFINLLRSYEVGEMDINNIRNIDTYIIKYGENYKQFRLDYSKKVNTYLNKINIEFLKNSFKLRNKSMVNDYLKSVQKGHLMLIDDNFKAILKNRIISFDTSLINKEVIRSQNINKLYTTYMDLMKNK